MRAMILAAGRGERMRPLTDRLPKPLLTVGGKPLIVWHIERLVQAGIRDIIVNHAWLGELVEAELQDGRRYGARIAYSPETLALETAGGILQAMDFFQGRPFLVVNGDIWCDWNPAEALQRAAMLEREDKLAWLLLTSNPPQHPAGDFFLSPANEVLDVAQGADRLTFTGIGVYRPALFHGMARGKAARLAPLLRRAMAENRVAGQRYGGTWVDVGTPERLNALDQWLSG